MSHAKASDLGWEEAVAFGEAMGALAGFAADGLPGLETGAMTGMADLMDGHLFDEEDAFGSSNWCRETPPPPSR